MREIGAKRAWLGLLCAAAVALGAGATPASGASSEPLFTYVPVPPVPPPKPPALPKPPPTGYFNGPCGLAVDSAGNFYVSDYYHHAVDVFNPSVGSYTNPSNTGAGYITQLANEDPLDGPCGLAFDASNDLYVNNYHRNVAKFNPSPSFGAGTVFPLPVGDTSHHLPTGVAVDPVSGDVYVDNRTYVSVYDSSGAPVMNGPDPLRIGDGDLGDGYGVAISQFPGTLGYLYVPDAVSDTVKVYDPGTSTVTPVAEIKTPLNEPFVSLRDSAVAVDRVTGDVYFVDDTQPQYTEKPQATIYVYGPTANPAAYTYEGHLKYNIADALPPGLTVDNSTTATQGRVYVTSGNTNQAGVYAYGPGAGTFATPLPPTVSLAMGTSGSGAGAISASSPTVIDCASSCDTQIRSGATVVLDATPDQGSTFEGWSGGGCSGSGACTVRMSEARSVSAEFAAEPQGGNASGDAQATGQAPTPSFQPRHSKPPRHRHKHRRRPSARHPRHRIGHRHRVLIGHRHRPIGHY